jgi:ribosomal protein S18 acetylase RimI-like enzyme
VNLRRYRSTDRDAVIDLFRDFMDELTPPSLRAEFDAYVETAIREELSRIAEYYASGAFWVAEDDRVVGMVGVEPHGKDAAELRRMAVDRQHRRKGIGRKLLAAAEAYCRASGYRKIVLSTSELQVAARRLYEASGYRLVREEVAVGQSHKTVGAGLTRYHYEK